MPSNQLKDRRRQQLYQLLGDLPDRNLPISAKLIAQEQQEGYVLEKLMLELNGTQSVPAYFVRPLQSDKKMPVVLFSHSHGGRFDLGKDELTRGNTYLQSPSYAVELTRRGYCALSIDQWCHGERRGRSDTEVFYEMLWNGQVLWGKMVYDSIRAIDYLQSRSDVDGSRIATLGISMGSTMSWWLAALDERVKVCVDLCCLTDFHALLQTRGMHGIYYYVPSLLKHFTTAQINALISPRPHLAIAGIYDRLTPPEGLDRIDAELRKVYESEGASDAWKLLRYQTGHFETASGRQEVLDFLRKWL